jgi:hypothetical protein
MIYMVIEWCVHIVSFMRREDDDEDFCANSSDDDWALRWTQKETTELTNYFSLGLIHAMFFAVLSLIELFFSYPPSTKLHWSCWAMLCRLISVDRLSQSIASKFYRCGSVNISKSFRGLFWMNQKIELSCWD